ncbi:uncharacterized protein [Procambarus clarkii]|uniref:uncharacterized protein isoform X1 n=1 Tax=Procambarus clarkii TaxID=6728 RepID=UPI0037425831
MDGVVNKCQVCTEAVSKYKCPKCRVKYCSVVCYKTHRQDECHASSTESDIIFEIDTQGSTSDKQILFPTDDTVMPKTLENLRHPSCRRPPTSCGPVVGHYRSRRTPGRPSGRSPHRGFKSDTFSHASSTTPVCTHGGSASQAVLSRPQYHRGTQNWTPDDDVPLSSGPQWSPGCPVDDTTGCGRTTTPVRSITIGPSTTNPSGPHVACHHHTATSSGPQADYGGLWLSVIIKTTPVDPLLPVPNFRRPQWTPRLSCRRPHWMNEKEGRRKKRGKKKERRKKREERRKKEEDAWATVYDQPVTVGARPLVIVIGH